MKQLAKYLGQRSFLSKAIARTLRHTHTPAWSVEVVPQKINPLHHFGRVHPIKVHPINLIKRKASHVPGLHIATQTGQAIQIDTNCWTTSWEQKIENGTYTLLQFVDASTHPPYSAKTSSEANSYGISYLYHFTCLALIHTSTIKWHQSNMDYGHCTFHEDGIIKQSNAYI